MISLNVPLTTWIVVAAAVVIFVIITLISSRHGHNRREKTHRQHHHIVGFGSESDEFFIPGDPLPDKDNDNDRRN